MLQLFQHLIGRLGVFAIIFIFLMKFDPVKKLLTGRASSNEKLYFAVLFGIMGIAGTYMGVPIQNAIANSRVVGVALGGILGGPLVGFAAGVIAGAHRYLIDVNGFTAVACGLATMVEGLVAGLLYHRIKRKQYDLAAAFITGVTIECIQMMIILIIAKPFDSALQLVSVIGIPMIVTNSVGLAIFVELLSTLSKEQEKAAASQAQTALKIALKTLPYLRNGLNRETAEQASKIILDMTDVDAVSITDTASILAHKGIAEDHHLPGNLLMTAATRSVLELDKMETPQTKEEIGCQNPDCPLRSAVIVPLKMGKRSIGVLKLYRANENGISSLDVELANGLAHLFSNQLELGEIENQKKLLVDAEIKALQAQINPHFLFNAITTIIRYTRSDPSTAKDLLIKLADFFRKNINPGDRNVALSTEIKHCKDYLGIEKARFEDRISVSYEVDSDVMECRIPPLTLQPLVENALRHGILPKEEGGKIVIGAHRLNGSVKIFVQDDGVGMDSGKLSAIFHENTDSNRASDSVDDPLDGSGIAVKNVQMRLNAIYGSDHGLTIESKPGAGTTVSFSIPVSS
jgi:two-component system, LytTR family, sensor histidine kinase LytS